jgi:hypothetical protein
MDIEGGEGPALRGAWHTLSEWGPKIFLATHSAMDRNSCLEFLNSLDYIVTQIEGEETSEANEFLAYRKE